MPAVVTTRIHGPSLDDLDFWGTLDELQWSLDSTVWTEADLFSLAIGEKTRTRERLTGFIVSLAFCRTNAEVRARCTAYRVIQAHCIAIATTREQLHSGYYSTKMHTRAGTYEWMNPGIRMKARCSAVVTTKEQCLGGLRGHNWVVEPSTTSQWEDRVV